MILVRREFYLVFLVILIGLIPRLWHLSLNLQIHYDQGLHATGVWKIWREGQFSLLGHPTDADGIWHGPLFYWLMLPAYFLGRGDPAFASAFQIMLEAVSLLFLADLGKRLFSFKTGFWAVCFYSFSYGYISYSRWLSNVTPAFPLSIMMAWLTWRIYEGEIKFLPPAALAASVVAQLNGAIGVFLYPVLLGIWLLSPARRKITAKIFLVTLILAVIPHLPLLVFELRHEWIVTRSIFKLSGSATSGLGWSATVLTDNLRTLFREIYHLTSYPFSLFTLLLVIASGVFIWKKYCTPAVKFLVIYFVIFFLSLSLYRRGALLFFFVPLFSLTTLFFAKVILAFPRWLTVLLISSLLLTNIYYWKNFTIPSHALTPIGTFNLITNRDRKLAVDWIYQTAAGRPFAVWIYTIPYFLDEPWVYYFTWYGRDRYGYLPVSTANFSPDDLPPGYLFFNIYEPDDNQPTHLTSWLERVNSDFGPPLSAFSSNDARVDYRGIFPR